MSQSLDEIEVKPKQPWKPTQKEINTNIGIFVLNILLTLSLIQFTGFSGKLAFVVLFILLSLSTNFLFSLSRGGTVVAKNSLATGFAFTGIALLLMPVISILATVFKRGTEAMYIGFFTTDMSEDSFASPLDVGGIKHAVIGSVIMVTIALLLSVPIGILTALYLTELKGRGSTLIRFLVQAMSGIPSIVAGLFIYSALITGTGRGFSAFMGALALTILMIPTVARTSEEVLKLIPSDLREAGLALGATQWRTVAMVVIPAAKSGLITAAILGVARIAGETAPLLFTTGGADNLNTNPVDGNIGSVPFYVWKALIDGSPDAIARAWAGIFLLMIIVLSLFILARKIGSPKKVRS
jgi:phosphate transport system permease protein